MAKRKPTKRRRAIRDGEITFTAARPRIGRVNQQQYKSLYYQHRNRKRRAALP